MADQITWRVRGGERAYALIHVVGAFLLMLHHILDHEHHCLYRKQRDLHPLEVLTDTLRSDVTTDPSHPCQFCLDWRMGYVFSLFHSTYRFFLLALNLDTYHTLGEP